MTRNEKTLKVLNDLLAWSKNHKRRGKGISWEDRFGNPLDIFLKKNKKYIAKTCLLGEVRFLTDGGPSYDNVVWELSVSRPKNHRDTPLIDINDKHPRLVKPLIEKAIVNIKAKMKKAK